MSLSLVHIDMSAALWNSVEASPTSPPGVGGWALSRVSTPGPVGDGGADVVTPQAESAPTTVSTPATFPLIADILP
ncbi:hypothetical protein GCM10020216_088920 [Nonomuraea helvata]